MSTNKGYRELLFFKDEIRQLYYEKNWSYLHIARHYKTSVNILSKVMMIINNELVGRPSYPDTGPILRECDLIYTPAALDDIKPELEYFEQQEAINKIQLRLTHKT